MKKAFLILGTNGTGKTTLAKGIIEACGGIKLFECDITYTKKNSVALIGKYEGKFGGVDGLNRTSDLWQLIQRAQDKAEIIIAEGVKLHTFGINVLKAASVIKDTQILFLYAPALVIDMRIKKRGGKGVTEAILRDQKHTFNAVKKYASAGYKVAAFDTSKTSTEKIIEFIL